MDVKLLIDVREASVLIAELSTRAGFRTPLVHIADRELSLESLAKGITLELDTGRFGLALHLSSASRSSSCSRSSW